MRRTGIDPGRLLPQILILALALFAVLVPPRESKPETAEATLRRAVANGQETVNRWDQQAAELLLRPDASAADLRRVLRRREELSREHRAELARISRRLEGSIAAFERGAQDLDRQIEPEARQPLTANLLP